MKKIPKQEYTAEFKEQAIKHAQAVGIVAAGKEESVTQFGISAVTDLAAAGNDVPGAEVRARFHADART